MIPNGISDKDRRIINILKRVGYGYAKFASSVESSGRVTPKQRECMERMISKIMPKPREFYSKRPKRGAECTENASYNRTERCEGDINTSPGWYGYTQYNGNQVKTKWHDDGRTTYNWGGPCAPTTYDDNGEECS